jgi:hypothetical protein
MWRYGKVHPKTGHEDPDGKQRHCSTLSLTLELDGSGWSIPRPCLFTPGKETRYPLDKRLCGPQSSLHRCGKSSSHRDSISGLPSPQQVTILTEISWLTAGSVFMKWQFFVTDQDSCSSRQVTHTFCQNVSTTKLLILIFW